jgi:hypothetical protein
MDISGVITCPTCPDAYRCDSENITEAIIIDHDECVSYLLKYLFYNPNTGKPHNTTKFRSCIGNLLCYACDKKSYKTVKCLIENYKCDSRI